jgi:DUF2946 family protein
VLRTNRVHGRLRPWLAMLAAYALVLQLFLSGAFVHGVGTADAQSADLFAICHNSDGSPAGEQGAPEKPAAAHVHCLLCVAAGGASAILPGDRLGVAWIARPSSDVIPESDDRIVRYHSPTGQFQRGPPAGVPLAG